MPVRPRILLRTAALAALAVNFSAVGHLPAEAATPKRFSNCAEMQKKYPHGVGKSGAKDKTSGKPVTTFRIDTALYKANDGGPGERDLDRDNDGVACEKR